eukprot:Clim_evm12s15 gene=Clim_evmTU12s15
MDSDRSEGPMDDLGVMHPADRPATPLSDIGSPPTSPDTRAANAGQPANWRSGSMVTKASRVFRRRSSLSYSMDANEVQALNQLREQQEALNQLRQQHGDEQSLSRQNSGRAAAAANDRNGNAVNDQLLDSLAGISQQTSTRNRTNGSNGSQRGNQTSNNRQVRTADAGLLATARSHSHKHAEMQRILSFPEYRKLGIRLANGDVGPGEMVSGALHLEVNEGHPNSLQDIVIFYRCILVQKFKHHRKLRLRTLYSARQSSPASFYGIPPGSYDFPFAFQVPAALPPSCGCYVTQKKDHLVALPNGGAVGSSALDQVIMDDVAQLRTNLRMSTTPHTAKDLKSTRVRDEPTGSRIANANHIVGVYHEIQGYIVHVRPAPGQRSIPAELGKNRINLRITKKFQKRVSLQRHVPEMDNPLLGEEGPGQVEQIKPSDGPKYGKGHDPVKDQMRSRGENITRSRGTLNATEADGDFDSVVPGMGEFSTDSATTRSLSRDNSTGAPPSVLDHNLVPTLRMAPPPVATAEKAFLLGVRKGKKVRARLFANKGVYYRDELALCRLHLANFSDFVRIEGVEVTLRQRVQMFDQRMSMAPMTDSVVNTIRFDDDNAPSMFPITSGKARVMHFEVPFAIDETRPEPRRSRARSRKNSMSASNKNRQQNGNDSNGGARSRSRGKSVSSNSSRSRSPFKRFRTKSTPIAVIENGALAAPGSNGNLSAASHPILSETDSGPDQRGNHQLADMPSFLSTSVGSTASGASINANGSRRRLHSYVDQSASLSSLPNGTTDADLMTSPRLRGANRGPTMMPNRILGAQGEAATIMGSIHDRMMHDIQDAVSPRDRDADPEQRDKDRERDENGELIRGGDVQPIMCLGYFDDHTTDVNRLVPTVPMERALGLTIQYVIVVEIKVSRGGNFKVQMPVHLSDLRGSHWRVARAAHAELLNKGTPTEQRLNQLRSSAAEFADEVTGGQLSRPSSRPSSRPASRNNSRPGSHRGSLVDMALLEEPFNLFVEEGPQVTLPQESPHPGLSPGRLTSGSMSPRLRPENTGEHTTLSALAIHRSASAAPGVRSAPRPIPREQQAHLTSNTITNMLSDPGSQSDVTVMPMTAPKALPAYDVIRDYDIVVRSATGEIINAPGGTWASNTPKPAQPNDGHDELRESLGLDPNDLFDMTKINLSPRANQSERAAAQQLMERLRKVQSPFMVSTARQHDLQSVVEEEPPPYDVAVSFPNAFPQILDTVAATMMDMGDFAAVMDAPPEQYDQLTAAAAMSAEAQLPRNTISQVIRGSSAATGMADHETEYTGHYDERAEIEEYERRISLAPRGVLASGEGGTGSSPLASNREDANSTNFGETSTAPMGDQSPNMSTNDMRVSLSTGSLGADEMPEDDAVSSRDGTRLSFYTEDYPMFLATRSEDFDHVAEQAMAAENHQAIMMRQSGQSGSGSSTGRPTDSSPNQSLQNLHDHEDEIDLSSDEEY